jgi:hypothetical protein
VRHYLYFKDFLKSYFTMREKSYPVLNELNAIPGMAYRAAESKLQALTLILLTWRIW